MFRHSQHFIFPHHTLYQLELRFDQIVCDRNPDHYIYVLRTWLKKHNGGINDDTDGKIVTIIISKQPYHPHSHVALLDLYSSKFLKTLSGQMPLFT